MAENTLTILGSTGSIGLSALRVCRFLKDEIRVNGLACRNNISRLAEQIAEFMPQAVAVSSQDSLLSDEYKSLKKKYPSIEFLEGDEGVIELAGREKNITLSAIVGAAGLAPSLKALGSSKRIALANKETLVMAGGIFMKTASSLGTEIIPVDSEHSAVFSLLSGITPGSLQRIILTASGGSLRSTEISGLDSVTPEQALAHPTWNMGSKITIDSATLINKGLEVIEAHHLFQTGYDNIDVIIHPESVIHSMVETVDGSVFAHMGEADMALPIINALKYPHKIHNPFGRLDFAKIRSLNFFECDHTRYPGLNICYAAGRRGGTAPAVLNAANEVAVSAFLERKILFTDIVKIIKKVTDSIAPADDPGLEEILSSDKEARAMSQKIITSGEIK